MMSTVVVQLCLYTVTLSSQVPLLTAMTGSSQH
jgi:hypothetical protein